MSRFARSGDARSQSGPIAAERLAAVVDRRGCDVAASAAAPAPLVVGRVADAEPLFASELALARAEPRALAAGLEALRALHGASRALLALREDNWSRCRALREVVGRGVAVRVPAAYPQNRLSVLADLAERDPTLAGETLERAVLYDTATLVDVGRAVSGEPPLPRAVSVVGYVAEPQVVLAPLGTPLSLLVQAAGDAWSEEAPRGDAASRLSWVAYHNGATAGALVEGDDVVDHDTRGLLVLPARHDLVRRQATPAHDYPRRCAAACVGCRVCTDVCPVHQAGGALEPHRVALAVARSRSVLAPAEHAASDAVLAAALTCGGCNLCDVACPAQVGPAALVQLIGAELARSGARVASAPVIAPRSGRPGKRWSVQRVRARLGLADLDAARAELPRQALRPRELALPLRPRTGGSRAARVSAEQWIEAGEVIAEGVDGAAALRSPMAGRIVRVDPDRGIIIATR